jgi:hypothetical protein
MSVRDNRTGEWRDGCGCFGCGFGSALIGLFLAMVALTLFN